MARRVFVGLVQLGEGAKDTRRRAAVDSLISAKDDPVRVRQVLDLFSAPGARLITRSTVEGEEMVEVTHEALLEQWQQIKGWLAGQRDRIRQQRQINALAEEWAKRGKKAGYLLQRQQLNDARVFQKQYAETLPLSECAAEFLWKGLRQRWLGRVAIASFLILPFIAVDSFLRDVAVRRDYATLRSENVSGKPEAAQELVKGCGSLRSLPAWFVPVVEPLFGTCRTLKLQNLVRTDLSGANLSVADLFIANLSGANLFGANLSGANLSGAKFITKTQLEGAMLCNTKLPQEIKLNPDRDCKALGITPSSKS